MLNDCTTELYGVTLLSFLGTRTGQQGLFTGLGPDSFYGNGNTSVFTVFNNPVTYSKADLLTKTNAYFAAHGMPPVAKGNEVVGFTDFAHPLENYTANNWTGPMAMLKTQVHELGHSLSTIVGLGYPADLGGQKLEDCVKKGGGFKRH